MFLRYVSPLLLTDWYVHVSHLNQKHHYHGHIVFMKYQQLTQMLPLPIPINNWQHNCWNMQGRRLDARGATMLGESTSIGELVHSGILIMWWMYGSVESRFFEWTVCMVTVHVADKSSIYILYHTRKQLCIIWLKLLYFASWSKTSNRR